MEGDRRRDISGNGKLHLPIPPRSPLHSGLRHYPSFPFPSTPTISSTPIKRRSSSSSSSFSSLSSLFFLLFSLRSFYSLLPFLRSSHSNFSLFPFSFLVSLFSFILTAVFFFLIPSPNSTRLRPLPRTLIPLPLLTFKSLLLALGFLLRFQSLRSCGTAATIMIEFSGSVFAWSLSRSSRDNLPRIRKILGFGALVVALILLSLGWDRIGCFPHSFRNADCLKVSPLLLPFLSGILGFYECSSNSWTPLRDLGQRRLRLLSLGISAGILFFPALFSFLFSDDVGTENLGWSLANTVIFGVVLAGNLAGIRSVPLEKDFRREFLSTYLCTIALELFYNPLISLAGFLISSLLLWISVDQLAPPLRTSPELDDPRSGDSFIFMVSRALRHIWSERKSRKIFLFLLINSAYMAVEFAAGFLSNSLGLISDACHMLFDCAALGIGLYASYISRLPACSQFNYGRGRFEVLSGYVNAVFLVLVGALIVLESVERILDPQEISTSSVLSVSIGGLLVNIVGLVFFHEEHHHAHGGACSLSHGHPNHQYSRSTDHHDHHGHHGHDCHVQSLHHGSYSDSHSLDVPQSDLNHRHHAVHRHSHSPDHHQNHHHGHDHFVHTHHHGAKDDSHPLDVPQADLMHHTHSPDNNHHHGDFHDHEHCHHAHSSDSSHTKLNHHHHSALYHLPSPDHHHGGHDHKHSVNLQSYGTHDHSHPHLKTNHRPHSHSSDHHKDGCDHDHSHHHGTIDHQHGSKKLHMVDHNMRGIFLHVLADTMGSVGVVISTLLIKYKGWMIADPACSILISIMIVSSVIPLLKNSAEILLQRVPRIHEREIKDVLNEIAMMNGIAGVDRVHFWSFTTTDIVGTIHLRVSAQCDRVLIRKLVSEKLRDVGVNDLTIQLVHV